MPNLKLLFFLFILFALPSCKPGQTIVKSTSQPEIEKAETRTVLTIGSTNFSGENVGIVLENYLVSDSSNFEDTIDEILFQKRLYMAAMDQGYGNDPDIREEIDSYLEIVSESFLQDTSEVNKLARLTYERMKTEINASHLLIPISVHALPEDTLKALNEIVSLRDKILAGAAFDSLVSIYSGDINTKNNGGEMGWFSALQLLFPLENAVYTTGVGEVSTPVRTKAGYHILKVNDSRNFSGNLTVKHLLKAVPKQSPVGFESFQKNAIDSLSLLIQKGADFEELCQQNSDDTFTGKNGGILAPFSVGSRQEKAFEDAAFKLKPNEVSKPVRTEIGWHLIKYVDLQSLEPFDKLESWINERITTDSRGEYLRKRTLAKYYQHLNISENPDFLVDIIKLGKGSIAKRTWEVNQRELSKNEVLSIAGESFTNLDFVAFAVDKQTFEKQTQAYSQEMYLRWYYEDFKNQKIESAILKHLPEWDNSFKNVSQSYKENIIGSHFLNSVIYEKSLSDSLGQQRYYEKHIQDYKLPKKAQASIIKANKKEVLGKYFDMSAENAPYRLKRGILPIYFETGNYDLDESMKQKLIGLTVIMENNPNYIVEIGGHRDVNEEVDISYSRVQKIVDFLKVNGLNITKIREYDYGTSKLADRFDWIQNQRVSFQFFSNSKSDLVKILNTDDDKISITKGEFYAGENPLLDGTKWEIGNYEAEYDGDFFRIEVEKVLPERTKTFKEAYGTVLSDFQKDLEKQLKDLLTVKYPATLNSNELKKLYNEFQKKNL